MKYLFGLALLIVAAAGGVLGFAVVTRFVDNMTQTPRIVPGERVFAMPTGVMPRGGELPLPRELRELAAARANPIPVTPESIATGKRHYVTFCAPCHGATGKGDGPVTSKFIPPPDLSNPDLQKTRTDGHIQHYIGAGGAVMPPYGEALSPDERWHIVNFLRTLASR